MNQSYERSLENVSEKLLPDQTIMVTLFGVGLGPLSIGILSDLLIPYFGDQSLRYAMLFCVLTTIIAMLLI